MRRTVTLFIFGSFEISSFRKNTCFSIWVIMPAFLRSLRCILGVHSNRVTLYEITKHNSFHFRGFKLFVMENLHIGSPHKPSTTTSITLVIGAGMKKNVSLLLGLHHRLITPAQFTDEMTEGTPIQGLYIFVMNDFSAVSRLVISTSLTVKQPLSALWWPQKNAASEQELLNCAQHGIVFVPSISQNPLLAIKMIHGRLRLLTKIRQYRSENKKVESSSRKNANPVKNARILKKLSNYLEKHYSNENLCIDKMGQDLGMSRTSFYNKVKTVAGCSPSKFVTAFRMQKAKEFLSEGEGISEVAFKVGFSSTSYFTKCFKEFYNCTPSSFVKNLSAPFEFSRSANYLDRLFSNSNQQNWNIVT